jgi:hypothetical protein
LRNQRHFIETIHPQLQGSLTHIQAVPSFLEVDNQSQHSSAAYYSNFEHLIA